MKKAKLRKRVEELTAELDARPLATTKDVIAALEAVKVQHVQYIDNYDVYTYLRDVKDVLEAIEPSEKPDAPAQADLIRECGVAAPPYDARALLVEFQLSGDMYGEPVAAVERFLKKCGLPTGPTYGYSLEQVTLAFNKMLVEAINAEGFHFEQEDGQRFNDWFMAELEKCDIPTAPTYGYSMEQIKRTFSDFMKSQHGQSCDWEVAIDSVCEALQKLEVKETR